MYTTVSSQNSNLAHRWANDQTNDAKGVNMFADQTTIYSYGRHFAIAKHVMNSNGDRAILFTLNSYSNTTAKHINIVKQAINHKNIIYCYDPERNNAQNIEMFFTSMKAELNGLQNAKKPEKYIKLAEIELERAKKYVDFFNLQLPEKFTELYDTAVNGEYKNYLIAEAERIEKEAEEEEVKQLKLYKSAVLKWRSGKLERLYSRLGEVDFLRVNKKTGRIETTQGVEVPAETAKRAYKFISKSILKGGCTGNCKYKILDYEVTEITDKYIKIGCHKIEIKEIKKIAIKLNW